MGGEKGSEQRAVVGVCGLSQGRSLPEGRQWRELLLGRSEGGAKVSRLRRRGDPWKDLPARDRGRGVVDCLVHLPIKPKPKPKPKPTTTSEQQNLLVLV